MLLCFLVYVIVTQASYTVQFMNCLHCLLDKTMWNQQFGYLVTTPKFRGYTHNRLREKGEFQLHDTSSWQLPDSWFWCKFQLFVLWQFRQELWRKGWVWIDPCSNIQLPVDAFNVSETCDKKGAVVSMQGLNIFKTSMPRLIFTILATTKNRASIHAWCWHE